MYDIEAVRSHFPALAGGVAHFDGPGGSQVPDVVAEAIGSTLVAGVSNRGRITAAERIADDVVLQARQAMADLLGADPGGIVFGRSMTALTFEFARTIARTWRPGDEVVVSRLDHDGNIRPWMLAAESVGAVVRWAEFDADTGELPVENLQRMLSDRTRLVAVTAASNLIGTRPALAEIAALAHDVGALCYVDGVHFTAHAPVDMAAIDADFYACSPYKFLGPHCGVVAGRVSLLERLRPDKLLPSTDVVPERFELGTLPYELLAGTTAAVDFLASLAGGFSGDRRARLVASMTLVEEHEDRLRLAVEDGLAALPGVVVRSRAAVRTPTLLLTFRDRDPVDAYEYLAKLDINAPAGSFYAIEASRFLGLGDTGGLRVGLAPYSTRSDVDRLLDGLAEFLGVSIDPTRIDIEVDPQRQRMVGISAHGLIRFDVPFISEIVPGLWLGGCEDGLVLPSFIRHLVSLYPWERYTVNHELDSSLEVRMYDSVDQAFDQVDGIAAWVNACRGSGATLVHCQAGLNRSSLVAARALVSGGMPAARVIALIREKRSPACLSNPSFERWLLDTHSAAKDVR